VGPRAGLDMCEKSLPRWDFIIIIIIIIQFIQFSIDPRTVQPVASRYTD
jgi:hypothetical protein